MKEPLNPSGPDGADPSNAHANGPPAPPQPFALRCFTPPPPGLEVLGSVERRREQTAEQPGKQTREQPAEQPGEPRNLQTGEQNSQQSGDQKRDRLHLRYRLIDPQGLVRIPAQAATPQRLDELWEHTCLEAFLAEPGAEPYWELNLAPSGHWNLYRLSAYRQGLMAEAAISALPMQVSRRADGLDLSVTLDLAALPQAGRAFELGITAVLELNSGEILYWALSHPGEQADFHRREGFGLRL